MSRKLKILVLFLILGSYAFAQQKLVTGTVVDDLGGPLPGVTVVIQGTTSGTVTDFDGKYSVKAEAGQKLSYSFIGFTTQVIVVGSQSVINVKLTPDAKLVEEVVVVGYGTQKKASVVGSIAVAKGEDLKKAGGVTNISNALTGLAPGVVTQARVGKPGDDAADILIRGKSTWNDASPLTLVDGVERDMNTIDVNEVENVSVLKDASATAVYGVRGANGVILVTTKRGKLGKPQLKVGGNATVKTISKIPEFANAYQSRTMMNNAILSQVVRDEPSWGDYTPFEFMEHYRTGDSPYQFPDVDWQAESLNEYNWSYKANMDLSGGTDFVKYFTSMAYLYDGDVFKMQDFDQGYDPSNDFTRLNFRTNLDFTPTKTTTFTVDVDGSYGVTNSMAADQNRIWDGIYGKRPDFYPLRYEDGVFGYNSSDERGYNTVWAQNYGGVRRGTATNLNTTLKLNQKLDFVVKGLYVIGDLSFNNIYKTNGSNYGENLPATKYIDPFTGVTTYTLPSAAQGVTHGYEYVPAPSVVTSENMNPGETKRDLNYSAQLGYVRSFDKHNVTAMGNFKRIESTKGSSWTKYREEWAARVTYDFDNRYLFETNGAYNGSEQFGEGYKFGFFPSVALGWNVSNEKFFSDNVSWMNHLKFRYSIGEVGNDKVGDARWLYESTWQRVGSQMSFGTNPGITNNFYRSAEGTIGNPDVHWETATKQNLAIETGFLDNMFKLNVDLFRNHRYDVLMSASQQSIYPWFGGSPAPANKGETEDKGCEVEFEFGHTTDYKLKYYIKSTYAYVVDKVIAKDIPELTPDYQSQEGFPVGQITTTYVSGIINNWDQMYTGVMSTTNTNRLPGDNRGVDYNADGMIDGNDAVPFGYPDRPQISATITVGGSYKNWTASAQLYGTKLVTLTQGLATWGGSFKNQSIDMLAYDNAWLPTRTDVPYQRLTWGNYSSGGPGGQYNLVDGSVIRLSTVELAYTWKSEYLKKAGLGNVRFYVNGHNLWMKSDLNEDRETGGTRDNSSNDGFDKYPLTKRLNFGLDITF